MQQSIIRLGVLLLTLVFVGCSQAPAQGPTTWLDRVPTREPADAATAVPPAAPPAGGITGAEFAPTLPAPKPTAARVIPTSGAPIRGAEFAPPLCHGAPPPFITDLQVRQLPALPEPQARVPLRDPVFGACLVRVTDRKSDISQGDKSAGLKNEYSRVQSFNADESRILVRGTAATWYLYDAATLQPIDQLPIDGVDPRWDAANPHLLYYSDGTRFVSLNVQTKEQTPVHEFAADLPGQSLAAVWSKYEGNSSRDGRYWGFMAEDEDWVTVAFLVYDLQTKQVVAQRDVRGIPGVEEVDNAYISPLGNYFIADFADHYCERGQLGTDAQPCGYMVYDRNLRNGRGLLRISGHMDLALDAQGREVAVYQDIDTDYISMVDLATGKVTPLWPIDFSKTVLGLHISGRAFNRPGWVLVSTYNGGYPTHFTWMDNSVFAIELKPNGRVARLAHTRAVFKEGPVSYGEKDYWAEPHASVNRDFTRIVFTSNWGRSGTEEVEMFLIELPPDWIQRLP